MPRYFFDIRTTDWVTLDLIGLECFNLDDAIQLAMDAAEAYRATESDAGSQIQIHFRR